MGLCETQNRLGQKETLMLFFSKNKFKVHFVSFCPVFHTAPFFPTWFSTLFIPKNPTETMLETKEK
jgi:hypothetical protein